MARKCGECLMESVEVVELDAVGTCPRCGTDYGPDSTIAGFEMAPGRTNEIRGYYGEWYDRVDFDGAVLDPAPSQSIFNHSPDGFAWGYAGSGPAQLALAILLAAGVPKTAAVRFYQEFKREHIQNLPDRADFVLRIDVRAWIEDAAARFAARRSA